MQNKDRDFPELTEAETERKMVRKDKNENYSRGMNRDTSYREVEETVQHCIGTAPSPRCKAAV